MTEPIVVSDATLDDLAASRTFEAFYQAEARTLFRRLWLVTGNRAEAEELMQDAFLKVWERWERVGRMDDPVGYLYRTAMNLFRKRYRRAMAPGAATTSSTGASHVDRRSATSPIPEQSTPRGFRTCRVAAGSPSWALDPRWLADRLPGSCFQAS